MASYLVVRGAKFIDLLASRNRSLILLEDWNQIVCVVLLFGLIVMNDLLEFLVSSIANKLWVVGLLAACQVY